MAPSVMAPEALLIVRPYAPSTAPSEIEPLEEELSVRSPLESVMAPM